MTAASHINQSADQPRATRVPAELASASWPRFISAYLAPFRRRFVVLAIMLLTGIGLQLALPQIISHFIDLLSGHAAASRLVLLGAVVLGAALVNLAAGGLATYLGQDVGWAATNLMREDLARHLLSLDTHYHNAHTPGEFIERIDGDLNQLSTFFSILMIQVLGSGLLLVGTLVLLFLADWRMGLALSGFIVIAFAVLVRLRSVAVPAGVQEREVSAGFLGFLEERLAGVEDIRANGGGDYVMDRFYVAMRTWYSQSVRAWTRRASVWAVSTLLFSLGIAVTLGLSTYLYLSLHAITLGTAYLFFQYMILLRAPVEQISQQMQEFQKAASSLIRVRGQFHLTPRITDPPRAALAATARPAPPDGAHALAVRFEHVGFAYVAGEDAVLHDVDFELPAGEVLGLLGRTGSGKTTISRVLFRLYDVSHGAIRLNGVDIRDMPLAELRRRVGIVTQDVQLFQASVRENLTFFDPRLDDQHILDVIAEMGLESWLRRLPNGLDTHLDAGGGGLSAGEAQLLAFIRVFLRDPGLVILDEPSSRLDLATERLIERGVSALLRGRTGIIIAHRLATVRRADRIMTLGDGHILEYGKREELAGTPGSHFHALLRVGSEEVLA